MIRGSHFTLFPKWCEKWVFDGLLQGDALGHIELHHLLEQVEQLLVFRALGGHVLLEEQSRQSIEMFMLYLLTIVSCPAVIFN